MKPTQHFSTPRARASPSMAMEGGMEVERSEMGMCVQLGSMVELDPKGKRVGATLIRILFDRPLKGGWALKRDATNATYIVAFLDVMNRAAESMKLMHEMLPAPAHR